MRVAKACSIQPLACADSPLMENGGTTSQPSTPYFRTSTAHPCCRSGIFRGQTALFMNQVILDGRSSWRTESMACLAPALPLPLERGSMGSLLVDVAR